MIRKTARLSTSRCLTMLQNSETICAEAFEKVDSLISPTSPVPAFKLGERTADPLQMYLADIFTIAANLAGICGISVPCGFTEVDGHRLPIGLQLLGKPLDEARILQIAHAYEQSTDWHKARPPIAATKCFAKHTGKRQRDQERLH